jgi:hypothetical protein
VGAFAQVQESVIPSVASYSRNPCSLDPPEIAPEDEASRTQPHSFFGSQVMKKFAFAFAVMGLGAIYFGGYEIYLAFAVAGGPRDISLAKLLAADEGKDGYPYLILTDFELCHDRVLKLPAHELRAREIAMRPPADPDGPPPSKQIETENVSYNLGGVVITSTTSGDNVQNAWFPIVPRGAVAGNDKPPLKAFIHVSYLQVSELPGRCRKEKMHARIRTPYANEIAQLRVHFPDVDVSKCLILIEGSQPKGILGGIGLIALGAFLGVLAFGFLRSS